MAWPRRLARETLVVLAGTPVVSYGTTVLDWTNPSIVETIARCSVQAIETPEITTGNREAIVYRYRVFVPGYHAQLSGVRRIRWARTNKVYKINGDAPYWPDPTGRGLDHHVFIMEVTNG